MYKGECVDQDHVNGIKERKMKEHNSAATEKESSVAECENT